MITIDDEMRGMLEQTCQFARMCALQVGDSIFKAGLREYRAVIVMIQYGTTQSYMEVADKMLDKVEDLSNMDEESIESTKAMIVLASYMLSELIDENFNIIE